MYDLIIIGGGTAGYSAAMYAKRFEMNVIVISALDGGTITQTHLVENYPGFESITGYELGMKIVNHAKKFGVETKMGTAKTAEKKGDTFHVQLANGETLESKTLLLATGTQHRELGIESEQRLKNKGVSYCATCDGAFFKGKVVGMVGGSDSAVKESLLLAQYCEKVIIIYRGEKVRPEPINMKRMEEEPKIEVINKSNIIEVLGEDKVSGVKLDTGKTLELEGLFIEIGRIPQAEIALQLGAELNEKGEVKINRYSETNISGFYAAGDVTETSFKQAIVSAAEGSHAAARAFEFIG